MKKTFILFAIAVFTAASLAGAAPEVSEQKDVTIFQLGLPKTPPGVRPLNISAGAFASIDAEITQVFKDLGRFNIIGLEYKFEASQVKDLIAKIKAEREKTAFDKVQQSADIQQSFTFLTPSMVDQIVKSFIVVIPVIVDYRVEYSSRDKRWEANITTQINLLNMEEGNELNVPLIKTSGSDKESDQKAAMSAIDSIPSQLSFELRSVPEFTLKSAILRVQGDTIKMRLGKDLGVKKGWEFAIVEKESVEGFTEETEKGLIIVSDVSEELSTGKVIYSDVKLVPNLALKEIPRVGADFIPYAKLIFGPGLETFLSSDPVSPQVLTVGVKFALSDGVFDLRPIAGFESPIVGGMIMNSFFTLIPIFYYGGVEYKLYLGRLEITPSAAVGSNYFYISIPGLSSEESKFCTHIGGFGRLTVSYLLNRDMKLFAEAGFDYWLSISPLFGSFGGPSASAGVAFKM